MPKKLEERLSRIAKKRWPNNPKHQNRYVFGTLRKIGWVPDKKKRK